ncbi:hypothetical protein RFI_21712 [Reticulomyxa filosa]|uniref:NACHT domain-containing protein n=1 Tax=Reticulomyxa filosa TaxID=46433 RepID=X6MNS6_RETFI|nr:hypothetical protein RFI_21712 [Reticulomyxa filosa]|eukprot:ETO15653.1 hypothetical protein RFI_21712 [Reticulomyxa filosa]
MQDNNNNYNDTDEKDRKYVKEIKTLVRLFGDAINGEELQKKIVHHNGNIEFVIKEIVQQFVEKEDKLETDHKSNNKLENVEQVITNLFYLSKQEQGNVVNEINGNNKSVQKEAEKTEVGETKPGINLQGYCNNEICLVSKAKLLVWVNVGFGNTTFISDKALFSCPDCKKSTVNLIVKAMFYNSEHSICASGDLIPVKDNNYQCSYTIKSGLSYELKANKIRQHAQSIEDLRERSEHAMNSIEIKNLVTELQKYEITVVKPSSLKGNERLLEKIQADYGGDFNQAFDIGRFTILCDNPTKLQTAVAVMKKAEQFNLIVSEDKDFFDKQSKTHHRFHNIKLYVPKHDVYIEMQATLKNFTTLEGYTVIENPKLSHLFYEYIRAWKPNNSLEEELKQASDETLTKINDIICEWIDKKEIKKIANHYKPHSEIRILKPPQLKGINEEEVNAKNDITLKLIKFVYDQLCKFNPKEAKGQAIYAVLFEYFKRHIMGEKNPASYADIISILRESRKQELEEDTTMLQALEMYIPLQANNYPYTDNDDNKNNSSYDCYQHIIDLLAEEKEKEEKKSEEQKQQQVIILQGKSGSGKSLFCRHLEEVLWEAHVNSFTTPIPVYISLPKCYNELNEKQTISHALQMKQINKEMMDVIRENISFVFILDGFDEIFDKYDKNNNEKYFYDRFNLNEWNAKIMVTCRSHVLNDGDIQRVLIGSKNITATIPMIHLWPFSKGQVNGYIDKFVKMNNKNKITDNLDWTTKQYEETLQNYPNLNKMMEEPFFLRMILTVLPSLMKQHSIGTKISKSQVYEAFNEQWIDIHVKNISNKLSELRIQTNPKKIKLAFQQYCQNLGFEMFMQGNQVATENDYKGYSFETLWGKLDLTIEREIKDDDDKAEFKVNKIDTSVSKTHSVWKKYFYGDDVAENISKRAKVNDTKISVSDTWGKYFHGDSIAKYVLRRVGDNKYQFLHKSCQEYYAAQKIIFDILSWKPDIATVNNQQFQEQFETCVKQLSINHKLLNEELSIVHFIAERIHDNNPIFTNLQSRLFRIIEASKNSEDVSIAAANAITILNSANVNMHSKDWSNIKIPYAILDHAFLEGTNFSNANLDNVRFYQTCLSKANFTNASMNNIYFGEYAHLEGHSNEVTGIIFSPDWTKIASYSIDKTIRIWDTSSRKQLHVLKYSAPIKKVHFSHDGSKIVSCALDKTIQVWDVLLGQQIRLFDRLPEAVNSAEFSSDASKVVSCSNENIIRIWSVSSGEKIQSCYGHSDFFIMSKFFSNDSKILSCSERECIIWDASSGTKILSFGHEYGLKGVQLISDGSKVVSYGGDTTIVIHDTLSGQQIQIFEGHTDYVRGIQLLPDDSRMLSYAEDKTIRIWDLLSGKQLQVLEEANFVSTAKFSFDGSRIVSGSQDGTIRLWDISSGKQIQMLEGHSANITGVEFLPRESKILSCSNDGTIRIWDISLERKIQLTEGYIDVITTVLFSPDDSKILSASAKTMRLWDVQSGKQIQVLEDHSDYIGGVSFSPDGFKIVSYSLDKIRLWDVLPGKQLQLLEGHPEPINKVRFSPDGSKLVSCSYDKKIRIWDISSGRQIQLLSGHSELIIDAQFLPDGNKILSHSQDYTIRLWDALSGKQVRIFKGHKNFIFRIELFPDGSKFVSCSREKIIVWDISSGKQILLLEENKKNINEMLLSPDGTTIASCLKDTTIRLWDISTGKQMQILKGHSDFIREIKFSLGGSKLLSYSEDKIIRIWDVSSGKQIQALEGHNGSINAICLSHDDSKLVSCSSDKTIRLWRSDNGKIDDITKASVIDNIWRVGIQSGLSMKDSIWKNTKGLEGQQKLLAKQRGGKF